MGTSRGAIPGDCTVTRVVRGSGLISNAWPGTEKAAPLTAQDGSFACSDEGAYRLGDDGVAGLLAERASAVPVSQSMLFAISTGKPTRPSRFEERRSNATTTARHEPG